MPRKLTNIFVSALLLVSLLVCLVPTEVKVYAVDDWWDYDWLYRQQITLDNTASAEDLLEFPVLVHLDDTNIDWDKVQNAGEDVRFVDTDATELSYEIDTWDDTNDAYIWVNVPQVDLGVDTDYIYIYYGNDEAVDGQDVAGTWNSGFVFVSHMNDNPDTSYIKDSTSNGNNGAKKGANEPVEAAGLVGKAQDFDGGDDNIICAVDSIFEITEQLTIEAMIFPTGWGGGNNGTIVSKANIIDWRFTLYSTGALEFRDAAINRSNAGAITLNNWHLAGIVFNHLEATELTFFADGSLVGTANHDAALTATVGQPIIIGSVNNNLRTFDGLIGELHISNIARSAEWIEATNLQYTEAFSTFGGIEYQALAPANFTLGIVDENQVDISWALPEGTTVVQVRRAINDYPASIADGVQVYSGSGTSYSDTADEVGLETDKYTYYYRAWGQNALGQWSVTYAEGSIGGTMAIAILLGVFIILCLGLTIGGYALHRGSLAFSGATAWLILGAYSIAQSGGEWNIYMGLFWLCLGMLIVCCVEGALLNRGEELAEDKMSFDAQMSKTLTDMDDRVEAIRARRGR